MKQSFYKFSKLLMICLIMSVFLSSCEKDEDKINAPDSLVGTSWLWEADETVTQDGVEIGIAVELDFISTSKVDINILVGGIKDNTFAVSGFSVGSYNYTYKKPDVTIIDDDETSKGRIDGSKLTIDGKTFFKEED